MTNAFAAAANAMTNPVQQAYAQAQPVQAQDTSGNLTDAFTDKSQLFGGPTMAPSLVNKTHGLGSVRYGVIKAAPYDVQARDFNTKEPKFFLKTPVNVNGKIHKVGPIAVDPTTGQPNDKVLDTVIPLDTEYRFTEAESAAVGRDHSIPDDGERAFYLSGDTLKQFKSEMRRIGGISSTEDLVGLKFMVERVGQKPNPGGNPSWVTKLTLSR